LHELIAADPIVDAASLTKTKVPARDPFVQDARTQPASAPTRRKR
jgi:hypothetical protein